MSRCSAAGAVRGVVGTVGTLLVSGRGKRVTMESVREHYWRYSLFVIILALGAVICVELAPYVGGLLGAMTIYVLLRGQMSYLTESRGWCRGWAATLLLAEAVVCFLIPLTLIVWMLVSRVQDLTLDQHALIESVRRVAEDIYNTTGYDLLQGTNVSSVVGAASRMGQALLEGLFSFGVNIVILLFVLYFMLVGGARMEAYFSSLLPFDAAVARSVMHEIYMIVHSNAVSIPLIAIVQGGIAYVGYLLCGVNSALFWGVVTCFATVIPVVGTALVWVPLAAFMALNHNWGGVVGLIAYGVLVVTQSDNILRFILQRKMADTHPVVTIFGVLVGLPLFGFMGVIFGPLILAMFIFFVHLFKRKYIDRADEAELFDHGA